MIRFYQKYRCFIGVHFIVFLALVSITHALMSFYTTAESYWSRLGIHYFEERYADLLPLIPDTGIFGYVCDHDDPVKADVEYILSIYQLAPRLLTKSDHPELVIGNFRTLPVDKQDLAARGLTVLRDCGNGVLLLTGSKD